MINKERIGFRRKAIGSLKLSRSGQNGQIDGEINACLLHSCKETRGCSIGKGRDSALFRQKRYSSICNLIGKDMRVKINDHVLYFRY